MNFIFKYILFFIPKKNIAKSNKGRIIKVLIETPGIKKYMSNDKLLIYKGSV